MSEIKPVSPVDQVIDKIAVAMHEWAEKQKEGIAAAVHKRLDQHRDEVLMKLMGFNTSSWRGGWEIDHCNGRNGNSPIGDFLKTSQEEAIKGWLRQIELPELTPAMKAAFKKELKQRYTQEISSRLYDIAKAKATTDINAVVEEMTAPTKVEAHLRMQQLLNPTTKP